jgi:hypothetical protein
MPHIRPISKITRTLRIISAEFQNSTTEKIYFLTGYFAGVVCPGGRTSPQMFSGSIVVHCSVKGVVDRVRQLVNVWFQEARIIFLGGKYIPQAETIRDKSQRGSGAGQSGAAT